MLEVQDSGREAACVFAIVLGRAYVQRFRFHGHAAVGLASALRLLSVVVCGWFSCRGPWAGVVRPADDTQADGLAPGVPAALALDHDESLLLDR